MYLVSTLAVTATGAIIFAACEEFAAVDGARRQRRAQAAAVEHASAEGDAPGAPSPTPAVAAVAVGDAGAPNLWDLGLFIFDHAYPTFKSWPTRQYLDSFTGAAEAERVEKAKRDAERRSEVV